MTDSTGDEENLGVREMEKEDYENLIEKLNNELANLSQPPQPCLASNANQRPSQNTSCNSTAPTAPPHCSKCHHPGHKRENNSVMKCNFCPSNTCTSSGISTQCSCQWHQQHQQQTTNQDQPVLPVTAAKAPVQQVQSVTVIANQHHDVTEWLLPNYLSQSTIGGRMSGSNACTVIALLTGFHFLEGALAIPKELKDLSQTIPFYSKMIFKGNHIYNTFNLPANQPKLDVQNVLQQNHEQFQKIKIDADMGCLHPTPGRLSCRISKPTYKICSSSYCAFRQINPVVFQPAKYFPFREPHTWPTGRNNIHKFLS